MNARLGALIAAAGQQVNVRVWRVIDTSGREYRAEASPAKEPLYRNLDGFACTLEYKGRGGWGTARSWERDEREAVVRAALDAHIQIREVLDPREQSTAEQLAAQAAAADARLDAAEQERDGACLALMHRTTAMKHAQAVANEAMAAGLAECERLRVELLTKEKLLGLVEFMRGRFARALRADADTVWSELMPAVERMCAELEQANRRAEAAEAVANEAMRVGRETCVLLDEERRWIADQRLYLNDSRQEALAEIESLRAILAGRAVPPTDEEIATHAASGGWWLIVPEGFLQRAEVDIDLMRRFAQQAREPLAPHTLWFPFDARRRPCAWPAASAAR